MIDQLISHLEKKVSLSENDIKLISSSFTPKTIVRGQHVFRSGEICPFAGYVVKGAFRYYMTNDKLDEFTTRFAFDDWWIGDIQSLFNQEPSNLSLEALETSVVLTMDKKGYDNLLAQSPAYNEAFRISRNKGFEKINQLMVDKMSKTAEERYLDLFSEKSPILERVPLKYIASYLGIKAESLSRIRKNIFKT